ncbi:MAG: alpha/beta hydrolase [Tumebacillaceae bacterium]
MLHKQLVFRDAQIAYYIEENKDKETILMLHPAFADHQMFEAQVDELKEQYQLILFDMPGHGASQVNGSKVTLRDMPEIINQLMAEHQIPVVHLLGVSMGSIVAQAFADRYPDRVQSVTIVGGYSIHKANERVLKAQQKEGLRWLWYILFSMNKFREHVISSSCYSDRCREVFRRGIQTFNRRSFSAMAGMNSFFRPKESPVPYPLLIITGKHDLNTIQEAALTWHQVEAHSQFVSLPDAGHCANLDAPVEFNKILQDFLATNASLIHS